MKLKKRLAIRMVLDYKKPCPFNWGHIHCDKCVLREQCTKAKSGRTIHRDHRHDEVDTMRECAKSAIAKQDIQTRKHLMERSFARAVRYGFKRARWRGLWRVMVQDYIIATIQNLAVMIKCG